MTMTTLMLDDLDTDTAAAFEAWATDADEEPHATGADETVEPEPRLADRTEAAWAELLAALPRFLPSNRDWVDGAVCASIDPELFFPVMGQPATKAKQICASCPVRRACLDWQVHVESLIGSQPGVYGGLTQADRRTLSTRVRRCRYDDCGTILPGAWDHYCEPHRMAAVREAEARHGRKRRERPAAA